MSDKVIHRRKFTIHYTATPKTKDQPPSDLTPLVTLPIQGLDEDDEEHTPRSDVARAYDPSVREPFISNHSGYGYKESSNYEHDDTGDIHNYSGVLDEVTEAQIDHEGLTPGYDYD